MEERELTVHAPHGGWLIDFRSTLTTDLDKVRLDGDPQHAGFHFRANDEVEKTKNQTYFLRPDGEGRKGKEVNWDPKTKKGPVNRPWTAMSFVVDGKRYTVVYLDHPDNPKEARQSETHLRPHRHLLRVRPDQGQAAEGEIPPLGPGGRSHARAVRHAEQGVRGRRPREGGVVWTVTTSPAAASGRPIIGYSRAVKVGPFVVRLRLHGGHAGGVSRQGRRPRPDRPGHQDHRGRPAAGRRVAQRRRADPHVPDQHCPTGRRSAGPTGRRSPPSARPPAMVEVSKLIDPDMLVEVEADAVLPGPG